MVFDVLFDSPEGVKINLPAKHDPKFPQKLFQKINLGSVPFLSHQSNFMRVKKF